MSSFMITKLAHRDHPNQSPASANKLPVSGSRQIGSSGPNPRPCHTNPTPAKHTFKTTATKTNHQDPTP